MKNGHWGDVRGTGDALIAFGEILRGKVPNLRSASLKYLLSSCDINEDEKMANWNEEVWDSAIALIALNYIESDDPVLIKIKTFGINWLLLKFKQGNNNWNEEPWETLWALLALSKYSIASEHKDVFSKSFDWLNSLYKENSGILINWHYTALYLIVENSATLYIGEEDHKIKSGKLSQIFLSSIRSHFSSFKTNEHQEKLWTKELWSNALVLWAYSERELNDFIDDFESTTLIYRWFENAGREHAIVEDIAFSSIALFSLLKSLKVMHAFNDLKTVSEQDEVILVSKLKDYFEVRFAINSKISGQISSIDFCEKMPIFSSPYERYYTFNFNKRIFGATAFLVLTATLSLGSSHLKDYIGHSATEIITFASIFLGILATFAQLFGITIHDFFGKKDEAK